jgi:hypothetical protein
VARATVSERLAQQQWVAVSRTRGEGQPRSNTRGCCAGLLEDGVDLGSLGLQRMSFDTFESNVLFVLRYMIDAAVVGGCWVSAPRGKYRVGGAGGRPKLSTCQLDLHLSYRCGPPLAASGAGVDGPAAADSALGA